MSKKTELLEALKFHAEMSQLVARNVRNGIWDTNTDHIAPNIDWGDMGSPNIYWDSMGQLEAYNIAIELVEELLGDEENE